jgi:hypothetical protein
MKRTIVYILFFVSILSLLVGCRRKETLQINPTELTMQIGETTKLEIIHASGELIFASSDENVATVNEGEITAVAIGNAVITVSDDNSSVTCNIKVEGPKYDGAYIIDLDTDVVDLIIGDEYQLEPQLLKGQDVVSNANFKYTSFDENIISIENGKIKALAVGEAAVQIDAVGYTNVSKLVKTSIFLLSLSNCIKYSLQAPHGVPTSLFLITHTSFIILFSPLVIILAIAFLSAHIPNVHAVSIDTPL